MLAVITSLFLGAGSASGIVSGTDTTKVEHAALAEPFEAVGALGGMGTGTLIADRWVVTAAHAADFLRLRGHDPIEFTLSDGRSFEVEHVAIHPDWVPLEEQMARRGEDELMSPGDLALLRLAEPVTDVEPMPLGAFDEANPDVMLVGIGAYHDDPDNPVGQREVMGMKRGEKHAGTNRVDLVDRERGELVISLSSPGDESATEHEVGSFAGDSGGPILSKRDGVWTVVGVIASVKSAGEGLGGWGDVTNATSIAAARNWIEEQMDE